MAIEKEIIKLVEEKASLFTSVSDKVWDSPELGFKEEKSAAVIIEALKSEGFDVKTGLADIPTAFSGTFGSGKPVIGFLGEFDALPNLSQEAGVSEKKEVVHDGNGHGCGHNMLGAGSLAAAVALKDYMTAHNMPGTVVYYGCPGEEFGCGKAFMARAGVFDDLDCALTWHPFSFNATWAYSSLANITVFFSFKGKTAHAASAPHMGRSALDAAELMNVGVNYLREHIISDARVHYAYHDAGGQAPNVVQDRAKLYYYIRAPKIEQSKEILERIERVAKGAAMMTDTELTVTIKDGLCDYVPNNVITKVLSDSMSEIGNLPFDEEDEKIASEFHKTLSEAELKNALGQIGLLGNAEAMERLSKEILMKDILPFKPLNYCMSASTDVGDVSYVTPTAQMTAATGCIGTSPHTWQMTAQGKTSIAHKAVLYVGKSLALCAVKLLNEPELLEQAHEEYVKKTGGKYNCPFPDYVKPLLD